MDHDQDWQDEMACMLQKNNCLIHSLRLRASNDYMTMAVFMACCSPTFSHLTSAELEDWKRWGDEQVADFIKLSSAGWRRLVFREVKKDF